MQNAFEVLKERGFIEQLTHEDEIKALFASDKRVTFYIGFDPTADSLTVGHFLPVMAMAHLQRCGHRPIALIGGGTTRVGDPTDKTDMRKMLSDEQINSNAARFKEQLSSFLDFSEDQAIMINNADWLCELNYIDFLREVGVHFSVNRMLTADCYKSRMEKGLTFLEFNYMLMQSYDFLALNKQFDCVMQLGGNDQWSNILGGVELIRRKEGKDAFGMTLKLLTTSEGKKMGKTEKGAVWLDAQKTSPYEFFQYWRNVEDAKVEECLGLLTFLPMDEVRKLGALEGAEINKAKEVLAFELTKTIHGEQEAQKALEASKALFAGGAKSGSIPTSEITLDELNNGIDAIALMIKAGLVPSRSEGRRVIEQGGLKVNEVKITDINAVIIEPMFNDGEILLQKGKKSYHLIKLIK